MKDMKSNIIPLLLLASILLSSTGCRKNECVDGEKAVLRDLNGLDGCGFVVELTDGTRLEPVNLSDFSVSLTDGKPVWVEYHEISSGSICMVGTTVQIDCLEAR
jgi:hypothetical protein